VKNFKFIVLLALLISCKTQQIQISNLETSIPVTQTSLLGTKWKLVKMYSLYLSSLNDPVTVTLIFNAELKNIGGKVGCNEYWGEYQIENSYISFPNLAETALACTGSAFQIDAAYLKTLDKVQSIKTSENKLYLLRDGKIVLEFLKQ
jgi:heat shock protein HslJ